MITRKFHGGALLIAAVQALIVGAMLALPVTASQFPLSNPTSGTLSGLSMVQNYNNAIDAVASCNSGGSAPATQFLSGSPSNSDCWDDTSVSGWIAHRIRVGSSWIAASYFDVTNSLYVGIVGGGASANVPSAATTDLCSVNGSFLFVTGSASITSFGTSCQVGQWKRIYINTGAGPSPTLVESSGLILPTLTNIATAPGDMLDAVYSGLGQWIVTSYTRSTGAALSSNGLNVGASALGASALASFQQPVNLQINTSVASNQLTVAIKGVNGADPSSSNPVLVGFRSQTTQPNAANIFGSLQAALSFTLTSPSTNSMGCTTAVECRLWVTLICQTESTGTCTSILLALSNQSTPTQVYPLAEEVLQSTGAGTGGGTSAGTIQTSVASLSGKAIRIIGYINVTWTSGTGWGSPTKVQLFGPGVHKPGERVQLVSASTSASTACNGSNVQTALSGSITPTSPVNLIRIEADADYQNGSGANTAGDEQLSRGSGPTYIGPQWTWGLVTGSASNDFSGFIRALDAPATTSSTTYYLYCTKSAGSGSFNAATTPRYMFIEEIMGALEPANDDAAPLRLVG
jgi:hypothetical protein